MGSSNLFGFPVILLQRTPLMDYFFGVVERTEKAKPSP